LPQRLREFAHLAREELARLRNEPWYLNRGGQRDFFRRAFLFLSRNGICGDYAEFGCWSGKTFATAYHESRRIGLECRLWALDSFRGLPPPDPADTYPGWTEGAMCMGEEEFRKSLLKAGVPASAYEVVPGYYDETLAPGSLVRLPEDISLAYVDCDLYSSTRSVLAFLSSRLKHGMLIAFDDYFCYSRDEASGERRAAAEILETNPHWRFVPYLQYGWSGMSFVVEKAPAAH
jgi:O-methyltransferase